MKYFLFFVFIFLFFIRCSSPDKQADLLVTGGKIFTCDSSFQIAEAMIIHEGKVVAVGKEKDLLSQWKTDKILNLEGKNVVPGFHDGHAHFAGLAMKLRQINLTGTPSWKAVLDSLVRYRHTQSSWILGRGWDQNDWEQKDFPDNTLLDSLFPDRPVFLTRVDGHAAIANSTALRLAGINEKSSVPGGAFIKKGGKLTGVLIDNAMDVVKNMIPEPDIKEKTTLLLKAQQQCLEYGITAVTDCGMNRKDALLLQQLQKEKKILLCLAIFLSDRPHHVLYPDSGFTPTDRFRICGIKAYADGALGSRGACLLREYSDAPGNYGFLLTTPAHLDSIANILYKNNKQLCIHAIGDSAVRTVLKIYSRYLTPGNRRNWRIEHCQVVHPDDLPLFRKHGIIPSVQPVHALSDAPWATERLGKDRIATAYAYRHLMEQSGYMVFGTDFPVESVSPVGTFVAAVFRKNLTGWPSGGYFPEQAIDWKQALTAMTRFPAESVFLHHIGSLGPGKYADFVITDIPWDVARPENFQKDKDHILKVYIEGQCVYENKNKK